MKLYHISSLVLLVSVALLARSSPIPNVVDLQSRSLWRSVVNRLIGNAPRLGAVKWAGGTGPVPHPVIVTDHKANGQVGYAQVSHNLPQGMFPHQEPVGNVAPSTGLTGNVNTGRPDYVHPGALGPDPQGRKAGFADVVLLKMKQMRNSRRSLANTVDFDLA